MDKKILSTRDGYTIDKGSIEAVNHREFAEWLNNHLRLIQDTPQDPEGLNERLIQTAAQVLSKGGKVNLWNQIEDMQDPSFTEIMINLRRANFPTREALKLAEMSLRSGILPRVNKNPNNPDFPLGAMVSGAAYSVNDPIFEEKNPKSFTRNSQDNPFVDPKVVNRQAVVEDNFIKALKKSRIPSEGITLIPLFATEYWPDKSQDVTLAAKAEIFKSESTFPELIERYKLSILQAIVNYEVQLSTFFSYLSEFRQTVPNEAHIAVFGNIQLMMAHKLVPELDVDTKTLLGQYIGNTYAQIELMAKLVSGAQSVEEVDWSEEFLKTLLQAFFMTRLSGDLRPKPWLYMNKFQERFTAFKVKLAQNPNYLEAFRRMMCSEHKSIVGDKLLDFLRDTGNINLFFKFES